MKNTVSAIMRKYKPKRVSRKEQGINPKMSFRTIGLETHELIAYYLKNGLKIKANRSELQEYLAHYPFKFKKWKLAAKHFCEWEYNDPRLNGYAHVMAHFFRLLPYLNKINPAAIEERVINSELGVHGMVDCVGYYGRKKSIIEFKTTNFNKSADAIRRDLIQAAMYACLVPTKNLVILTSSLQDDSVNEIVVSSKRYTKQALELIKCHHAIELLEDSEFFNVELNVKK